MPVSFFSVGDGFQPSRPLSDDRRGSMKRTPADAETAAGRLETGPYGRGKITACPAAPVTPRGDPTDIPTVGDGL